jgi:MFS transporter, OFA family, oxalate/formate antiporter
MDNGYTLMRKTDAPLGEEGPLRYEAAEHTTAAAASIPPGTATRRAHAIRTLIGTCIATLLGPSPLVLLSFGVYLLPIVEDTGWDRAVIASSIGTPMVMGGVMAPVVGWLTNHFGPRRFLTFSFPLFGIAIMLLGTPTSATMFVTVMALAGVLISGQTLIPVVYCISGWFEERRGLALGIMLACTGVSLALVPPLAAHLIAQLGWRATYFTFGAIVLAVSIPVARLLIADPPAVAVADRAGVPGLPWRKALATRRCWLLMGAITLLGAAASAGVVNLNVLLVERGVSAGRASFVMSVLGVSMILARLLFGYLFDRVRGQWLTASVGAVATVAFLIMATVASPTAVVIAAVLIGISFGAEGDALSYMTSRAFGMRDFGTIFGLMFLAFTTGGSLGPVIFALLKSQSGNYQSALWLAAGGCALATIFALLIRDRDLPFSRHSGSRQAAATAALPKMA